MTGAFYDGLAGSYDLMFPDWDASMARQAGRTIPMHHWDE